MTERALRLLRQDPRLAELAAFPFAFDLSRTDHVEEVRLASGGPLEAIAGDDSGGTYFVCADGSVLYADSEGSAGVIGDSVDEALEILVGLPGWQDYVRLSPDDDEARILAEIADTEGDFREDCVPDLDAHRAELRAALGFPERSPVQLVARLHAALLRTEPDHLLLNAVEHLAYRRLDPHPRPPLWEQVLTRGRTDLALLRTGDRATWDAVAGSRPRRVAALRAAQYDRRNTDRALLRHLLKHEASASMSDELRLAVVLVGLYGLAEDLPLLRDVHETDYDTWCGLGGLPEEAEQVRAWARSFDDSNYGVDPDDEPESTWLELARGLGLIETARAYLIRELDDTESDATQLTFLGNELGLIGDYTQAIRAQRLYVALQDTEHGRAAARSRLAELERKAVDGAAAES
ncbi:hypothetical protein [Streptomyces sp. MZ04]|uniref:hypothetical protein n=1 Tax=Streptomyces sp. MZ04 TaxID=2559236 RepID=UPI00107E6D55|nr:hypothetical protein [Streptomyces sp. MZ04]TGB08286.1 hypothetical protein E2651_19620 [Streptomyces sp. MZ04]